MCLDVHGGVPAFHSEFVKNTGKYGYLKRHAGGPAVAVVLTVFVEDQ